MLQLHRRGKIEEEALQRAAREYIGIYKREGDSRVLIPFKDVTAGRVRYVVFEYLAEQWCFVDITD